MEKWSRLEDDKKLKWISRVVKQCINYIDDMEQYCRRNPTFTAPKELKIKSILTKSELTMWEESHGKPPRPPTNIFDLYLSEFSQTEEGKMLEPSERRAAAEVKFKELDWYQKESIQLKHKAAIMNYKMDIKVYYQSLPRFLRVATWNSVPKRYQYILEEVDKVPQIPHMYAHASK